MNVDSPNALSELSDATSSEDNAAPESSKPNALPAAAPTTTSRSDFDNAAMDMLVNRGYRPDAGEQSPISPDKDDGPRRSTRTSARLQASQIQKDEVVKVTAPYASRSTSDVSNALAEHQGTTQALQAIPSTHEKLATLLTSVSATKGAEDILSLDPADRLGGYSELENWVDGSLDMYRVDILSFSLTHNLLIDV